MAPHWQAESPVRVAHDRPADAFRGLRAFQHSWKRLELAATRGDALELAAASVSAGRACLADGDLDEARWHLQRGRRVLDVHAPCPPALHLQCELAQLSLQLADATGHDDEQAARRLRDDTRDDLFEVVRRADSLGDHAATAAALSCVAHLLESLGDISDAETVRRRLPRGHSVAMHN